MTSKRDVYLLIYNQSVGYLSKFHYSLVIDTYKESVDNMICGHEFHIGAIKTTKHCFSIFKYYENKTNNAFGIGEVEISSMINFFHKTERWFHEFIMINGHLWSDNVNSEEYVKFLLKKMNIKIKVKIFNEINNCFLPGKIDEKILY